MKKWMTLTLLALLSAALLSACGGKDETATPDVDLTDFYEDVKEEYGWSDGYMTDIEGELLESYYPGAWRYFAQAAGGKSAHDERCGQ